MEESASILTAVPQCDCIHFCLFVLILHLPFCRCAVDADFPPRNVNVIWFRGSAADVEDVHVGLHVSPMATLLAAPVPFYLQGKRQRNARREKVRWKRSKWPFDLKGAPRQQFSLLKALSPCVLQEPRSRAHRVGLAVCEPRGPRLARCRTLIGLVGACVVFISPVQDPSEL